MTDTTTDEMREMSGADKQGRAFPMECGWCYETPYDEESPMIVGKRCPVHVSTSDQLRSMGVSEPVIALFERWSKQGRTDEQRYGVVNFLTGAGIVLSKLE